MLTDGEIEDKDKKTLHNAATIEKPRLWSPDAPYRYTLRTTVVSDGEDCDTTEVKFGFRRVTVDPNRGLFINGKHYKIKGFCGHADCGLMGKAVPDNIHRYKVQLMKEMGANAYRTSHYPQSEALMEELDANGFIVMDETRWFESTDEGKAQLEMLIKRDRNRACVVFWSVGNEEYHFTTEQGRRMCRSLMSFAHKLDDSRFIMTAVDREGTPIPDASIPSVEFSTGGDCRICSTGSDITEHDTIFKTARRMRAGRISVAVKLGEDPAGLRVIARADGLRAAVLHLRVKD